jgi:hypothetical protein
MPTLKRNSDHLLNFKTISQDELPAGRTGKHHELVKQLLDDLERLEHGRAIKIALSDLPDSRENVRSALNRATRKRNLLVATSSDAEYFYIWKNLG